ncbi:bifunctional ADP-dependent (S)-NAD(P)H-hydrate dehydratase/NAD(P)H-hydrate epimerase [Rhodovulum viride]|uniref:Bifunctional NAD(P)H-hydrate repair enzyme n=1 Tax=Rhodovulum viride TaxID=1231134 RepID=A0ABX9DDD7_9RHOB|nr:NAD(P)H-hydrate dehydratase [Rhodovulum viride]RAP40344.1 bifunctional ADP-dependent (S)-NAD(P)H-hydrate dehydratase/NAD(P)H-hydrate epimerase [Rhodovulum viride]
MAELLTSAQMRAIEADAMARGDADGATLMERAGEGVVAAALAEWPDLEAGPKAALVLCGPGNNGGDGFVVARLLAERGWRIELFLFGAPDRLPPDARRNHDSWASMGRVRPWDDETVAGLVSSGDADLAVDALFGSGCCRGIGAIAGQTAAALDVFRAAGGRTLAVDMPSGLCTDSGRDLGGVLPAALTVTFHRARIGQFTAEGSAFCGRIAIADIGLDQTGPCPGAVALAEAPGRVIGKAAAIGGHKYSHGHALVLAGGPGRTGAARLAARGALRVGAGLVTLAAPGAAQLECACHLTAVMLRAVDGPEDLTALLDDPRFSALCLGPGMGTGPREAALLAAALASGRPAVLDADALRLLAKTVEPVAALHGHCVLTPHGGEFARLFPDLAERLAARPARGPAFSRIEAVRAASARSGAVVLLKGADTAIAAPDGRAAIHAALYDRAAPWLATAGSGDVLAGLVTGLLARGRPAFEAAAEAAWLHADAARRVGPGLIAEDLPDALPAVFRALDL